MKTTVAELRNKLNLVKAGLSLKETTDQSGSFVFDGERIITYNDEISVQVPFKSDFEGAVYAKELLILVNKLQGAEANLSTDDNELKIICGKSKAGLAIEEIRMPIDEVETPKKWRPVPSKFKEALKGSLFSTSKDHSTPVLTCVYCKGDEMHSTDTERATVFLMGGKMVKMLIPYDSAKHLLNQEIKKYNTSEEWVHFLCEEGVIFSCRTIDGEFPNLDHALDVDGQKITFPESLKDILDRAGIFIDEEFEQDKTVEVTISQKGVLKARSEGNGKWYEETVRIKQTLKSAILFHIQPQYLIQILSSVSDATVNEERILFESEDFKHVVALALVTEKEEGKFVPSDDVPF